MLTQIHAANIECFKQKTNFVEKVRIELTALCLQSNVATLVHAPGEGSIPLLSALIYHSP